ncbi:hypothetical protein F8388_001631 [Cannabis sativa]|uniref:Reverse transcriptase zinc-binding domain-containing protein n=1 Tax=Cannabis sativa TaxID=3483 RepID=A0A7J6HJ07_CANSA|nr:hypothetical protein F8388_001631 [Cannabis sativa]
MALALKQQSKVNWIKFSDENSSYFHVIMRKERLENRITTFMKGDVIIDDFEEVVKHLVKHFENFMDNKSSAISIIDEACVKQGNYLSLEQQDDARWYFKKILSLRDHLDESKLRQAVRGGKISTKRCYNMFVEETQIDYAGAIWDKLVVPKYRFIYWQISNSQLLTRDYLHRIMAIPNNLFPVCEADVETHEHLFFNRPYSYQVFEAVNKWLGTFHWPRTTAELLQGCCNTKNDLTKRIINVVMAAVYYFLWKSMNKCVYDLCCMTPSCLSIEVRKIVHMRIVCKGPFKDCKRNKYLLDVINNW